MTTKNLSALADKARIAPTKSKDKFCHENFPLVCCIRIEI